MSFGNQLKEARERQRLSIQDLSASTRIRGDYLRALEAEDLRALPERTFTRSYVLAYGKRLGLDTAQLLSDFDRQYPAAPEQQQKAPPPRRAARRSAPMGLLGGIVGGLLLLGVAGYFGLSAYQAGRSTTAATPSPDVALPSTRQVRLSLTSAPTGARVYVDNRYLGLTPVAAFPLDTRSQAALRVEYGGRQTYEATLNLTGDRDISVALNPQGQASTAQGSGLSVPTPAATAAASSEVGSAAATGTSAAAAGTTASGVAPSGVAPSGVAPSVAATPSAVQGVVLRFNGPSWTRVTGPGGGLLYEGVPAAGSTKSFPAGVTVRTGSAGQVTASVNGASASPLGAAGQVVTRKF